jgi:hypothetical protein
LQILEKANLVWEAGYLCALTPSSEIDNGKIVIDSKGHVAYNGRNFKSVLFLYPQYSKEPAIEFLEKCIEKKIPLMIEGECTSDFAGNNIQKRFGRILSNSTVRGFSIASLPQLGIVKNDISNGCRLYDGSVVMTDLESVYSKRGKPFSFEIDGTVYSGEYIGIFALKASAYNGIEKLTCGGFRKLIVNGEPWLELKSPADIYLENANGKYQLWIKGNESDNKVEVFTPVMQETQSVKKARAIAPWHNRLDPLFGGEMNLKTSNNIRVVLYNYFTWKYFNEHDETGNRMETIVQTSDGRKILLNPDFTWEFAGK